ncbi:dynein axonemal assembly factor 9 [Nematolebias whitei]|uniref:dynein axonemal assembly factor 9 n=1 Tax=Nematolebias whitei TaxID=451745 RepID=UPI00189B6F5C|nr:dynein axonemal assembly factor 9 [Nematolebias whitei]
MAGMRRVNGKFSRINPAVSCCRLRQVQALLRGGGTSCPDGILCSLGIDSRYNMGCTELAKYLFYELYGQNQLNLEQALEEFPEETLDDVILLIKAECVHLYCNPQNYGYLLPYVSHWRNLRLYCMMEAEYEDQEAAEEFKISSFVAMVQDCHRIGVPYSSQGHVQKFDIFTVEKWPLIQAFALEGIGGGSFFTIKYKLMDMSEKLWQVYNRLDPVSLENLLAEDLGCFEKQWSSFFSSLDLETHLSILDLSEAQAGEAFRTFYTHGLISNNITEKSKRRQPFVLFGKHSSSEDLDNYSFSFPSESHQVRNTGSEGSAAQHMVLQCVAPVGPLSCSRTYFFGSTHRPYIGAPPSEQIKADVLVLSQIYSAVVGGVLSGIKCFSSTSSLTKAKDVAENTFLTALDSASLGHYRSFLRSRCAFSIQAVNQQGTIIPLTDEGSRYVVKTASMIVHDVPDLQRNTGSLGSVVFSESFLESSINIQHRDGTASSDSCFTVLTGTVPRYACWLMESDVRRSEQAQQLAKEEDGSFLGAALTAADAAYILCSGHLSSPGEGKLIFFSEGLLFVHSQFGSITVSKSHITNIIFYDPDSVGVASLFVEYDASLLPHLPFPLHSRDQSLVFALQPRSRSHRSFYSKVLSVWKRSESGLRVQLLDRDQLSSDQQNLHNKLQLLHDAQEPPVAKRRSSLKTWYQLVPVPTQTMFLQHFALSSISQEPILDQHLEVLFPSAELRTPAPHQGDEVVISIITGLPGSHKNKLCSRLLRLSLESGGCAAYRPDSFSATHLQQYLTNFLRSRRERSKRRLLLLTPGYTDVLDVVQAVLFHPDPAVRAGSTIGAVTACVDPLSSCMEHRLTFPKLLEQCSQGFVSAVVFTGLTAEEKSPLVQHVQQLVRSANPTAAFIRAERGAVIRDEDLCMILSESSFSEPQMLRARYVLYPGWCRGHMSSGSEGLVFTQQLVAFSRPLERSLFVSRCKAFRSSLKSSPFMGNIYNVWGRVQFSDSDWTMEVCYNAANGSLSIVPDQNPDHPTPGPEEPEPPCFLVFDGVGLTQDGLKDWLRLCAKQKQEVKMKKSRNTLSLQELSSIHTARHLDPLPPGYFYNGHQYVDIFGEKQNVHPNMKEFIEEYVAEANKEIDAFNRRQEEQPDLFDP